MGVHRYCCFLDMLKVYRGPDIKIHNSCCLLLSMAGVMKLYKYLFKSHEIVSG